MDIRKPLAYDHRTKSRAQIAKLLDALDRKLEALNGPDMGVLKDFGDVHSEGRRNVLNQAADLLDGGNDSDVDVFSELVNITGDYDTVAAVTYEVLGYDGIIPTDTDMEVIALTPAQIKSATDNVGTYSSADDDINYSEMVDNNKKSERLNAYFAMSDGATTIPLTMLRPGKIEKESSIQNAQRFMREAANGLREKRKPKKDLEVAKSHKPKQTTETLSPEPKSTQPEGSFQMYIVVSR